MITLGISAFYHDSAAALVRDGTVIAAAQEERFTRKKGDADFPQKAIEYCLSAAGITVDEVDYVGFYDKPLLTFDRLLETYLAFAPRGFGSFVTSIPVWMREKILQKRAIQTALDRMSDSALDPSRILFDFHHNSHAASAFYPSPFETSAVMVVDGVGEWATTSLGLGKGSELDLFNEIRFPHSIGMLYSAFTSYLGFKINDGEYKVMGLAPYGEPSFVDEIYSNLVDLRDDGSFRLDMRYFNYCTGLTMTNERFNELLGGPPRNPAAPLTQRDMDLARSVQVVTEDVMLKLCGHLAKETGERNLCLAGGVALNCVANGRILREGPFDNIWIQPAAGDAGGSLGVALSISHTVGDVPRTVGTSKPNPAESVYLGPSFDATEVRTVLDRWGASYRELDDDLLYAEIAAALADEKVVGWFQGRMEFGPRALGNRSILGDARSSSMQRTLNLKIKYRESFRPFAPAVLADDCGDYFDLDRDSPYMLIVADVVEDRRREPESQETEVSGLELLNQLRSDVPAITHVDHSARIQTVREESNPQFYRLLQAFKALTGYAVLVNTSFNVRDEPIVCNPDDAYRCFMATEMDVLVLGNIVLRKEDQ